MVVDEPLLAHKAGNAQEAGYGALARCENGADQEHLSVPPTSVEEQRREC